MLGLKVRGTDGSSGDIKPSDQFQGFFFDNGNDHGQIVEFETTLNEDGTTDGGSTLRRSTVADVIAAKEAGHFTGIPSRVLVVVDEPPDGMGNGLDFWFEILRVLREIQQYAKAAADAVGPWATLVASSPARMPWSQVRTRWDLMAAI